MALFGDNSKRTKTVQRYVITAVICTLIIALSIPMIFVGRFRYFTKVERSSTPIGTALTFPKSSASITLRGLYTDKNENVLLVRLHRDEQTAGLLPSKGTSYSISIANKQLDNLKEYPILFDSTTKDGDFLLAIPKPNEDVYTVFVSNNVDELNLTTESSVNSVSGERSIESAIAGYEISSDTGVQKTAQNSNVLAFRVALKPYLNGNQYAVTKINKNLMKGKEFDVKEAYNSIFIEPITENTNSLIRKAQQKIAGYTKQQNKWKEELSEDAIQVLNQQLLIKNGSETADVSDTSSSDTPALADNNKKLSEQEQSIIQNILSTEDNKKRIEENITKLGEQLIRVQKSGESSELFSSPLEKAGVLNTEYLKQANERVKEQAKKE
jgi:hypothetical protein